MVQNTYDLITLNIRIPGVTGLEIIAITSGHLLEETIPDLAGCADAIILQTRRSEDIQPSAGQRGTHL